MDLLSWVYFPVGFGVSLCFGRSKYVPAFLLGGLVPLHWPPSSFYWFAFLCLVYCPVLRSWLSSGSVFQ